MTDPENVWDASKYITSRRQTGTTELGIEYNFTYTYLLGVSYMVGTFGKEALKVEVFYQNICGFQVVISDAGGESDRHNHAPHHCDFVLNILNAIAST